jgi:hypothetical protein
MKLRGGADRARRLGLPIRPGTISEGNVGLDLSTSYIRS